MHWVLQNNIFNEAGFARLLETLQRLGLSYSRHKVIPFIGVLSPPLTDDDLEGRDIVFDENTDVPFPEGPKIVMGSYTMALYARKRGWYPGSFDNENLDFEKQVPHWGARMLNSDALVCRFADVPKQKEQFFIRPTLDSKSFSGHTTYWSVFKKWKDATLELGAENGGTLDGDTLVQVCPVKPIYREYRLWVIDGKVVTASLYKVGKRVHYSDQVDDPVIAYGEETAAIWTPARAFVLDVCDTPDGLRVLEAGCINAAGFYAANMQKLVMTLEDTFGAEPAP